MSDLRAKEKKFLELFFARGTPTNWFATHRDLNELFDQYELSSKHISSKKNVDPSLFNEIINLFSDTATYSSFIDDCFAPRFVLQFKFKRQERFRIIICQECSNLITTTPIYSYDKTTYKINGKLESVYKNEKDLSWEGSRKIDKLCKTLKMGYCKNYK